MKKIISFLLVAFMCISLCGCMFFFVKAPNDSTTYIGLNYTAVIQDFEEAGFQSISTEKIEDVTNESKFSNGEVSSVTVDGIGIFSKNAVFTKDANVQITYHTEKKIELPYDDEDMKSMDANTIAKILESEGFVNLTFDERFDLDPDTVDVEFENEVIINGSSDFSKGKRVPYSASIEIITHRPYEKYNVSLHINFIPNLLFNKYDVNFSKDYVDIGVLEHGVDGDYEFRLKEGRHTFEFESLDSSEVRGEFTLDVTADIEASFILSCSSDEISLTEEYVDYLVELSESEAKISCDNYEFTGENYQDVIRILQECGFQNIVEKPLYDIVFGFTEEGSVGNVLIDGSSDYSRGDIFDAQTNVTVSYHMSADKDPSLAQVPFNNDSVGDVKYTEVVKAFEDAGFTNVTAEAWLTYGEESQDETVSTIYIDDDSTFYVGRGYEPDVEVRIVYNVIIGESAPSEELTTFYAKKAFEEYGEMLYPYGFKCHWTLNLINMEKSGGTYYFKVGVTITNMYGVEKETIAEGMVSGTDDDPKVIQFHVSDY